MSSLGSLVGFLSYHNGLQSPFPLDLVPTEQAPQRFTANEENSSGQWNFTSLGLDKENRILSSFKGWLKNVLLPQKSSLQPSAVRGSQHLQVTGLPMTGCWSLGHHWALSQPSPLKPAVVSHCYNFLIPRKEAASAGSESLFTVWMFERVNSNYIRLFNLCTLSLLIPYFPGGIVIEIVPHPAAGRDEGWGGCVDVSLIVYLLNLTFPHQASKLCLAAAEKSTLNFRKWVKRRKWWKGAVISEIIYSLDAEDLGRCSRCLNGCTLEFQYSHSCKN